MDQESEKSNKKRLFIAGTDTGVGKTIVAAGLVRLAREKGLRALAMKPVETGCPVRSGMLYPEDGAFLLEASNGDLTLDECTPFRFSLPASPYRAAAMEGKRLKVADIVEHCVALAADADLAIVEGAGGLMVPLGERVMMIDVIVRLGYPVLLVARSALGTVNHTMLSLEALEHRGITTVGIVLSCASSTRGLEEEFTPRDIARLVGDIPVQVIPHLSAEILRDPSAIAAAMKDSLDQDSLKKWLGF
jgi:dethiobiotin synthetase